MKKFVIPFISMFIILTSFTSCSNFTEEENTSLTLTFNGSDIAKNFTGRTATVNSNYDGYYLVINLLGDYKETKTIPFSETGSYTITFDSIPVGAEVYIEGNAYCPSSLTYTHIFNGSSGKINILPGDNSINLSMNSLTKNISPSNYDTIDNSYSMMYARLLPFEQSDNKIYFFKNGKFIIQLYDSELGDFTVSEGIWSGSFQEGNTIKMTEYTYRPCRVINEASIILEDSVIISDLETVSMVCTNDFEGYFSFTSKNGMNYFPVH